jgi:hypothetical protein
MVWPHCTPGSVYIIYIYLPHWPDGGGVRGGRISWSCLVHTILSTSGQIRNEWRHLPTVLTETFSLTQPFLLVKNQSLYSLLQHAVQMYCSQSCGLKLYRLTIFSHRLWRYDDPSWTSDFKKSKKENPLPSCFGPRVLYVRNIQSFHSVEICQWYRRFRV